MLRSTFLSAKDVGIKVGMGLTKCDQGNHPLIWHRIYYFAQPLLGIPQPCSIENLANSMNAIMPFYNSFDEA